MWIKTWYWVLPMRLYNSRIQPRALSIKSNVLTRALMLAQGYCWMLNSVIFFLGLHVKYKKKKKRETKFIPYSQNKQKKSQFWWVNASFFILKVTLKCKIWYDSFYPTACFIVMCFMVESIEVTSVSCWYVHSLKCYYLVLKTSVNLTIAVLNCSLGLINTRN